MTVTPCKACQENGDRSIMGIMKNDTPAPASWLKSVTDQSFDESAFRGAAMIGTLGAIVYQAALDQSGEATIAAIVLATWLAGVANSGKTNSKKPEE